MRREHSDKTFACTECPRRFAFNSELMRHDNCVHKKSTSKFCEICGKGFYSSSKVKRHIAVVHENQRPHICGQCGKAFSYKTHLTKHETVHDRSTIYTCALCNKKFYYKESHRIHVKKTHPTRKPNDIIIISDNLNTKEEKLTPYIEGTRARLK